MLRQGSNAHYLHTIARPTARTSSRFLLLVNTYGKTATTHAESGMRYQTRQHQPHPRSDRAVSRPAIAGANLYRRRRRPPPRDLGGHERCASAARISLRCFDLCRFDYTVLEVAELLYFASNDVAISEETRRRHRESDAVRCPGQDHVARQERHGTCQECDQLGYREQHLSGRRGLSRLSIDERADGQRLWVLDFVGRRDPWSNRAEAIHTLGPGQLRVGALEVSGRDSRPISAMRDPK